MLERRCPNCNHLLFKYSEHLTIEIKCSKCKGLFTFASVDSDILEILKLYDEFMSRMAHTECNKPYEIQKSTTTDDWGNTRTIIHEMGQ